MKSFTNGNKALALDVLKKDAILRVPRDIESFVFQNKIDMAKYHHNKNKQNVNQSQLYIMDLID